MSVKRYQQFHGKRPKGFTRRKFHIPNHLVKLGKVHAIEYETDKLNGGGDGTYAIYRHVFETPAILCMDETGKRQLYIMGNSVKVTKAGIIN